MANEIQLSASITGSKSGASLTGAFSAYANLTGSEMNGTVLTMTTSYALVPVGGCDQNQFVFIRNMPFLADGTTANVNNLLVALDNGGTQMVSTIPPGLGIILCSPPALYWKASAGTPDAQAIVFEN